MNEYNPIEIYEDEDLNEAKGYAIKNATGIIGGLRQVPLGSKYGVNPHTQLLQAMTNYGLGLGAGQQLQKRKQKEEEAAKEAATVRGKMKSMISSMREDAIIRESKLAILKKLVKDTKTYKKLKDIKDNPVTAAQLAAQYVVKNPTSSLAYGAAGLTGVSGAANIAKSFNPLKDESERKSLRNKGIAQLAGAGGAAYVGSRGGLSNTLSDINRRAGDIEQTTRNIRNLAKPAAKAGLAGGAAYVGYKTYKGAGELKNAALNYLSPQEKPRKTNLSLPSKETVKKTAAIAGAAGAGLATAGIIASMIAKNINKKYEWKIDGCDKLEENEKKKCINYINAEKKKAAISELKQCKNSNDPSKCESILKNKFKGN